MLGLVLSFSLGSSPQLPVADAHRFLDPKTFFIWAVMHDGGRHPLERKFGPRPGHLVKTTEMPLKLASRFLPD